MLILNITFEAILTIKDRGLGYVYKCGIRPCIITNMKYLIFLLFVVALVHSQTANCKVREGMSLEKVYITQNETQAFSFRDYFTGFNLYYHAKAAEKTYKIIQSIYETSRLEIPAPP